jgi:hypothetical protein
MIVKWDLPPEPIPSWLDPTLEITESNDTPKPTLAEFIPMLVDLCLDLGCTLPQSVGVAANALSEVGYKLRYRGNNLMGWKLFESSAQGYLAVYGRKPKWWRSQGNKNAGDPPWCYYRAFDNIQQALAEWLRKFVPKPSAIPAAPRRGNDPYKRYRECGRAFWAGAPWFPLLIEGGYKGEVTQNRPQGSILAHESLKCEVEEWWAQNRLRQLITDPTEYTNFVVDGAWGAKSVALCKTFERAHTLPVDGKLDPATLVKIVEATAAPQYNFAL